MAIYFSEKFKQNRKAKDHTQEQLAEIFHVSPQAISRWENGNKNEGVNYIVFSFYENSDIVEYGGDANKHYVMPEGLRDHIINTYK